MQKQCFKCQRVLPMDEFYRHPRMADGHLGKCKGCTKADVMDHYWTKREDPAWLEAERARGRDKHSRLYSSGRTWVSPDGVPREKQRARNAVARALRKGTLVRGPCEMAGPDCSSQIEAHHDDYTQPLAVRWLCRRHHIDGHHFAKKVA